MRNIFMAAASAAALAFGSTAATAAPIVLSQTTIASVTPPASGTFGNSFNPTAPATSISPGLFNDSYIFNLTNSSLTDGSLITIALNGVQNIDFTCPTCSIRLDTFAFTPTMTGAIDVYQLAPTLLGTGNHTLFVTGNIVAGPSASYSGTVNFNVPTQGVPEPATWAMMLLGFGATGMVMRRRNRKTVLAQIA